jgi:hypothetical protein
MQWSVFLQTERVKDAPLKITFRWHNQFHYNELFELVMFVSPLAPLCLRSA